VPFFCFLSAKDYSGKWPGRVVTYDMFNSVFYNDDGTFRKEPLKETIAGSEYSYDYDPKFGEARLTISDSLDYIFAIIRRTTSCNLIMLVREPQYNPTNDLDTDNWFVMKTDSEMLDWMIKRFPRVAERMIWDLGN
jgi:hypothetical protein